MARKPKAPRRADAALPVETNVSAAIDMPVPKRRGRKPKSAEPVAFWGSDETTAGDAKVGDSANDAPAPKRGRPGRKPKQTPGPAAAAALHAAPKTRRGRKPRSPDAGLSEDESMQAEAAAPIEKLDGRKTRKPRADKSTTAPGSNAISGPGTTMAAETSAPSTQSAARWDKASDTVRFDWAAIEQTASQEGPNQVMAKLLVAARDEGANSRWPL